MTIGEILGVKDFDWMIHEHASKFKVMDGLDGTTVHETNDLNDALSAFDYCAAAGGLIRVKKRTHATNTWYPISDAVEIDASVKPYTFFQGVAGSMVTNVEIRPTNNTPAFILKGNAMRSSLENLAFTHTQSGYTKNMIHVVDTATEIMLSGLRFGTSGSGLYKGNGIGFEILTNGSAQYEVVIENIICRDMENFCYFNLQQADGSPVNFISSMVFNQIFPWNCKRVALATGISGAKLLAITFDNVHYQWSTSNSPAAGEAVYDFSSVLSAWLMRLSNCQTWDYPANVNAVNIGNSVEMMAVNSNVARVGGSGAARFKLLDYYNHAKGEFEINAIVGIRDYNITHSLGYIPKEVYVTITNQDINNQFAAIVPKSLITSSTFTIRLVGQGTVIPGTLNIKGSWRAYQ